MAFAHDTHRTLDGASLLTRLGEFRTEMALRLAQYRLYRATVNELSSLTDRELSDLGLCAADIQSVARQAAYKA